MYRDAIEYSTFWHYLPSGSIEFVYCFKWQHKCIQATASGDTRENPQDSHLRWICLLVFWLDDTIHPWQPSKWPALIESYIHSSGSTASIWVCNVYIYIYSWRLLSTPNQTNDGHTWTNGISVSVDIITHAVMAWAWVHNHFSKLTVKTCLWILKTALPANQ